MTIINIFLLCLVWTVASFWWFFHELGSNRKTNYTKDSLLSKFLYIPVLIIGSILAGIGAILSFGDKDFK